MRLPFVCALAAGQVVGFACTLNRDGTSTELMLLDAGVETSAHETLGVIDSWTEDVEGRGDWGQPDVVADDADDTAVPWDAAADTSVSPLLDVTGAPFPTGSVDLTAEGAMSWAHWGVLTPESLTRKTGTGAFVSAIATTPGRYDKYAVAFAWSDGDPTPVSSGTTTGIYAANEPLEFSLSAGTAIREVNVYIATYNASAAATFSLSDGSLPATIIALPVAGTAPGEGMRPQRLTATFRATTTSARLSVRLVRTSSTGSISLLAASLR